MAQDLVHLHGDVRDVLSDGLDPLHEAGPGGKPRDRSRAESVAFGRPWRTSKGSRRAALLAPGGRPRMNRNAEPDSAGHGGGGVCTLHPGRGAGDSRTIHGTQAAAQARHVARSCPRVCAPRASRGNECSYSKQRGSCQSPGHPGDGGPFPGMARGVCFSISSRRGYIVPK